MTCVMHGGRVISTFEARTGTVYRQKECHGTERWCRWSGSSRCRVTVKPQTARRHVGLGLRNVHPVPMWAGQALPCRSPRSTALQRGRLNYWHAGLTTQGHNRRGPSSCFRGPGLVTDSVRRPSSRWIHCARDIRGSCVAVTKRGLAFLHFLPRCLLSIQR